MPDDIPHLSDFHLAQRCLEGDSEALAAVPERHRPAVFKFLMRSGASVQEAEEVVDSLWADCVAGREGGQALLNRFDGRCALLSWLNKVALNALLTRKRREQRWGKLVVGPLPSTNLENPLEENRSGEATVNDESVEDSLIFLMRDALEAAFAECPAADFVLLQLEHYDGLMRSELARMFGKSEATISRALERAKEGIARATLEHVKQADPWLDLKWEDFIELCRISSPTYLGGDE